ncbi:hypothetical protein THRCLA_08950 [Thraustotheca clavata]|uniref:Rab-GAP TBC domain-containing protein n=1 Tax=Thraustotheca clavata TaxID=74557 RepID=A0A1V9Z0N7_9STRA|nr:hypothetical protein THRCLA_08950 [Thraustotheca clavata]
MFTFEGIPINPYKEEDKDDISLKYHRALECISTIFNKYYNGSHRAVDPDVIQKLIAHEDVFYSIQCHIEQGPAAIYREKKQSEVREITSQVATPAHPSTKVWFAFCGGYLNTPGAIMREWDNLGEISANDAMQKYIQLVDCLLPGWDEQSEYPLARQDRFWRDDSMCADCSACHTPFTMQNRRHHCRMCFDIFCHDCSSQQIELLLSKGGVPRKARICNNCKVNIDNDQGLIHVRKLIKENRDIKEKIQNIAKNTESQATILTATLAKLRNEAIAKDCNMEKLDAIIDQKIGMSPLRRMEELRTPPAHKFKPSESVEASEQLRLAHRQLSMCLKVAEVRSKKTLEKLNISIAVYEEAIRHKNIRWHPIALYVIPFLSVFEIANLNQTCRTFYTFIKTEDLMRKSIMRQAFPACFRPQCWLSRICAHVETNKYICDLAEALTSTLSTEYDSDQPIQWYSIMPKSSPIWSEAYALILEKCGSIGSLEHDKQISADVSRTFGRSAVRKTKRFEKHNDPYEGIDREPKKDSLINVLRAFTSTNSTVGYCQGMNFLAAFLLSNVQWNEMQAFWLMTSLAATPMYDIIDMYKPGVPLLNLRFFQLHMLVKQLLPELHEHFEAEDFHVSMCASGWFMTLYTNFDTLPFDAVVRVMDGFVVYGWKIIFRVALALLQYLQSDILQSSFENIVDIFYNLDDSALILHPEYLLHCAMKIKVTNSMLKALQEEYDQEFPSNLPKSCEIGSPKNFKPQPSQLVLRMSCSDEKLDEICALS